MNENKNEILKDSSLERTEKEQKGKKISIKIVDNRNPNILSGFDLDDFLKDLNILMTDENLEKANCKKYGEYFYPNNPYSEKLAENIRNAKEIKISLKYNEENLIVVKMLIFLDRIKEVDSAPLISIPFKFNLDGTFHSGFLKESFCFLSKKEKKELETDKKTEIDF